MRGAADNKPAQQYNADVERSVSGVDAVLEDFEKTFNPRALSYARVPGVIMIDDAQFMASDPGLMSLTARLLQQASRQSWPLLVIVTHWKRELASNFNADGRGFGAIQYHGIHGDAHAERPVAGVPGGYLREDDCVSIVLNPIDDLAPAMRNALPGLTREQLGQLLAHAGGNPRHLQQIIAYLLESEFLFDSFDVKKSLTDDGLQEALSATQDIFQVVVRRLRSAPKEVQEALCLASFQGYRFVSDIVNDLALICLNTDRAQALEQAHHPFSMVEHDAGRDVAEFSEQLFLRVSLQC